MRVNCVHMSVRRNGTGTGGSTSQRWLAHEDPFDPWVEEADDEASHRKKGSVHEGAGGGGGTCRVIIRARRAGTAWERMVSLVVGNPVHLDVVLARDGCNAGKFCFSSYMGQRFEVAIMNERMIRDEGMTNVYLPVSEEEYERCMGFMMALAERKTRYDYFDAMVLMPILAAPKSSGVVSTLVEDADSRSPEGIKKVFCSQSVVLMLRHALSPDGRHADLLRHINEVNSKLVSPRHVMEILTRQGCAQEMSNDELARLS